MEYSVRFARDGIGYTWPDDITFEQVLNLNGNQDQYQFGAHVVAAYLNAMEIDGYGQTPQDVIRITSKYRYWCI